MYIFALWQIVNNKLRFYHSGNGLGNLWYRNQMILIRKVPGKEHSMHTEGLQINKEYKNRSNVHYFCWSPEERRKSCLSSPNRSNPYDNIMQQAYIIRFSYVERNRNAAVLCCLSTRSINIKLICRCHKVIQWTKRIFNNSAWLTKFAHYEEMIKARANYTT